MPEPTDSPKTFEWILTATTRYFAAHGVDAPRATAEHLVARLLRCKRSELVPWLQKTVPASWLEAMRRGMQRIASGEPLQYVIGQWDFRDFTLKTDARALIPRPETEQLVELALQSRRLRATPQPRLIDWGTGSGCIAIALARALSAARVIAIDVSPDALALAKENAAALGVAQTLVGLPMYSGIGFRAVGLVVFYVIALFFLLRYCIKIKKDAKNSIMGENYLEEQTAPMEFEKGLAFDGKRVILIVLFLATVLLTVVGSLQWAWGLPEIAAIYFPVTIIGVILFRINPSQACVEFGKGMAGTIAPTMVIGFSRAVSVLLTEGNITDTIIHAVSGVLEGKSPVITLLIIFLFVTGFNFFVASGSGKAVVMMPILQPLGQVLGINQQVLVLAYQYGDGFTNTFWPTAALLQLSLCGMDYGRWFKFAWKVYACLIASGFILIVIANAIGYGPF